MSATILCNARVKYFDNAPTTDADVRVEVGRIAAIGPSLGGAGQRVVDPAGALVTLALLRRSALGRFRQGEEAHLALLCRHDGPCGFHDASGQALDSVRRPVCGALVAKGRTITPDGRELPLYHKSGSEVCT